MKCGLMTNLRLHKKDVFLLTKIGEVVASSYLSTNNAYISAYTCYYKRVAPYHIHIN